MSDIDPEALLATAQAALADRWPEFTMRTADVIALAAALVEARARLAEVEDEAGQDVLTAWRVRNAALAVAAAFVHPGPDHADETIRAALVREWVSDGHDRVDEENRQRQESLRRMIEAESDIERLRVEVAAWDKYADALAIADDQVLTLTAERDRYRAQVADVIARCESEVGAVGDSYDIGYEDAMSYVADWLRAALDGEGT